MSFAEEPPSEGLEKRNHRRRRRRRSVRFADSEEVLGQDDTDAVLEELQAYETRVRLAAMEQAKAWTTELEALHNRLRRTKHSHTHRTFQCLLRWMENYQQWSTQSTQSLVERAPQTAAAKVVKAETAAVEATDKQRRSVSNLQFPDDLEEFDQVLFVGVCVRCEKKTKNAVRLWALLHRNDIDAYTTLHGRVPGKITATDMAHGTSSDAVDARIRAKVEGGYASDHPVAHLVAALLVQEAGLECNDDAAAA